MNLCPCCREDDSECRLNIANNIRVLLLAGAMWSLIAFFAFNGYSSIEIISNAAASGIQSVLSLMN